MNSPSRYVLPPREKVVLRYVLEHYAQTKPDQCFVKFANGDEWTYARTLEETKKAASALRLLGVKRGDHVAAFLPSSLDSVRLWYGLNYLGAVYVPFNPGYKGNLLEHVVRTSDARLIVSHHQLAERLASIDLCDLKDIVHVGGEGADVPGLHRHPGSLLTETPIDEASLVLDQPIEPWDIQGIWYTSGTTGPSKGVLSSYMHAYEMFGPETWPFVTGDDRYMINLPMFHMGGTGLWNSMLLRGGSVAFIERYQTDKFWQQVRDTGATVVFLLGAMAAFLESMPPKPDDRDHPMRLMFMVPVVENVPQFAERFGVEVRAIYNMTEICMPIITEPTPSLPGTCGRIREGVEVRLVDENDVDVPIGELGEFIVRCDRPWGMNSGYYKMPEATAQAWRNGWFHTGDGGRMDADGNYYFVDRLKDAIRRRGEFVSSLELEIELCAHPDIQAAAAIAAKSDHAEDEIMVVLIKAEGVEGDLDFVAITEWLVERVAYFMVPRYWRVVDKMPMTPTEKIRKTVLREEGITADTWDREAAGIRLKSERLS